MRSQLVLLRLSAFLVDAFIFVLALILPTSLVSWVVILLGGSQTAIAIIWWSSLGVFLAGILLRDAWRGRSPGKQLLGLRIQTSTGRCGVWRSLARNLPLIVPLWNLLEVYLVLFGRGSRRTGDRISGTLVIEE